MILLTRLLGAFAAPLAVLRSAAGKIPVRTTENRGAGQQGEYRPWSHAICYLAADKFGCDDSDQDAAAKAHDRRNHTVGQLTEENVCCDRADKKTAARYQPPQASDKELRHRRDTPVGNDGRRSQTRHQRNERSASTLSSA